jgi:hypothetical protein
MLLFVLSEVVVNENDDDGCDGYDRAVRGQLNADHKQQYVEGQMSLYTHPLINNG